MVGLYYGSSSGSPGAIATRNVRRSIYMGQNSVVHVQNFSYNPFSSFGEKMRYEQTDRQTAILIPPPTTMGEITRSSVLAERPRDSVVEILKCRP